MGAFSFVIDVNGGMIHIPAKRVKAEVKPSLDPSTFTL